MIQKNKKEFPEWVGIEVGKSKSKINSPLKSTKNQTVSLKTNVFSILPNHKTEKIQLKEDIIKYNHLLQLRIEKYPFSLIILLKNYQLLYFRVKKY